MAKQRGIIKLEGTIGDITFHKSKDGYMAREKNSVSAEKIATAPSYQRTRENIAEFGRSGKAGKVLRVAFRQVLQKASDDRVVSRLTKEMMRVLQSDSINERGQRTVSAGDLSLLEGFEFNNRGQLGATLFAPYTAGIDRVDGIATILVDSFVPAVLLAAPGGATHFKFVSAAAAIDFELGKFEQTAQASAVLPWDQSPTTAITLTHALPAGSADPLFLVLGVEFLQEVNGRQYPLKNGAFNALALVKAEVA